MRHSAYCLEEVPVGLHKSQCVLTVKEVCAPELAVRKAEHRHHKRLLLPTDEQFDLAPVELALRPGFATDAQIDILRPGRAGMLFSSDIFAHAGVTDTEALGEKFAVYVPAFETLLAHPVVAPTLVLLQPFVNLPAQGIPDNPRSIPAVLVSGFRRQKIVNPGIGSVLDGRLVGIDKPCDRLPVRPCLTGNLPKTQFIYPVVVKNLLFNVHRNHCL